MLTPLLILAARTKQARFWHVMALVLPLLQTKNLIQIGFSLSDLHHVVTETS